MEDHNGPSNGAGARLPVALEPPKAQRLRILIANERLDRLEAVAVALKTLGHDVVGRSVSVSEVASMTADERPDIAFVGLGEDPEHALNLISEIVRESYCPVVALLSDYDAAWVRKAADRGIYGYIDDVRPEELQGAIEITLRRFADVRSLRRAIERREEEARRERKSTTARQRLALELHDGIVQELVIAQLSHDLGRTEECRDALHKTLESAKRLVSVSFQELKGEGFTTDQLIRASASSSVDR